MRLLVVTNDFPPVLGGIENYTYSLVRGLPPAEVLVYTRWAPGAEEFDRGVAFEVLREPVGTLLPTPATVGKVVALIASRRIDALHFPSALPLGVMGPRLGLPYALSVHGGEFVLASRLRGARSVLKWVFGRAGLVLPESTFAEKLVRGLQGDMVPLVRVTPGLPPEYFEEPLNPMNLPGAGPAIISVSRLVARKGPRTLIRALPDLISRHGSVRLLIVGGGPDADLLRKMATDLQVERYVQFAGPQPSTEVRRFYAACAVFALPTRERLWGTETEGLPLVFLEAAAAGLPLVGGRAGGVSDAVREGETGYLVDGSSPSDTARAISRLLEDPEGAKRMGERARQMVLDEYTWAQSAEKYQTALTTYLT